MKAKRNKDARPQRNEKNYLSEKISWKNRQTKLIKNHVTSSRFAPNQKPGADDNVIKSFL